ncbi:hypothetical protein FIBSPDRAFT_812919 [Athelia psychrophila]|uniref:G domain-containing protein n=1 Tax=Athelia psychrophila TaxID=1759441 RepID=A0A166UQ53_9AGAM|nr:hypothetical protein FIBSPDRAFT_812919 [Fibularhizoctonia sp. CBS 109695]
MGPPGSGKTTFIEYATQKNGPILQAHISKIRAVRTKHPNDAGSIIFAELPTFDDTNRSDIEILAQIADFLVKAYKEKIPVSIVYLHRIDTFRMAGTPLKNLQMFASIFGQEAMPHVVLATTMWSEIMPDTGARREIELKRTFWADMLREGCKAQRLGDSYESAWQILGELPTGAEIIILACEIYDDKKNLNETAAGVKLTEELNELIADQKKAAHRMEEQVHSQHNPLLVAEPQQRHDEIELKIGRVTAQLQQSKIPTSRKISNFFTGKKARISGV